MERNIHTFRHLVEKNVDVKYPQHINAVCKFVMNDLLGGVFDYQQPFMLISSQITQQGIDLLLVHFLYPFGVQPPSFYPQRSEMEVIFNSDAVSLPTSPSLALVELNVLHLTYDSEWCRPLFDLKECPFGQLRLAEVLLESWWHKTRYRHECIFHDGFPTHVWNVHVLIMHWSSWCTHLFEQVFGVHLLEKLREEFPLKV